MIETLKTVLEGALQRLQDQVTTYLPSLLAALTLFVAAYAIAMFTRWLIYRILKGLAIDKFLRQSGLAFMVDPFVVSGLAVQPPGLQSQAAHHRISQEGIAEDTTNGVERLHCLGRQRHRNVSELQRAIDDVEIGHRQSPQHAHFQPADIVGNESHDQQIGMENCRKLFGA